MKERDGKLHRDSKVGHITYHIQLYNRAETRQNETVNYSVKGSLSSNPTTLTLWISNIKRTPPTPKPEITIQKDITLQS